MFGTLMAPPAPLGFKFLSLHLCFITVMADISSRSLLGISLRGARNLQSTGTSDMNTVVPRCRPGYKDVTNGQAFMWSCAFHCEGGHHYATSGCACACQTQEQEELWREFGGISGGVVPLAGNASSARILVTPAPDPTRAPRVPVAAMSTGPIGEEGSEWTWKPPVLENYMGQTAKQLTTQLPSTEKDNGDLMLHLGVLALLFGGVVVCTAVIGIVCFNWESIAKSLKKQSKKSKVAEPPVFNLQPQLEKCPQPAAEVSMSSLVSGRTSASSNASRVPEVGSFKVSSKQSSNGSAVRSAQKDTRSLLKPPQCPQTHSATASTCSGTWSGTSSVNSQSFWAQSGPRPNGHRNPTEPGHPKPNSSSRSDRVSMGKLSKVQPV